MQQQYIYGEVHYVQPAFEIMSIRNGFISWKIVILDPLPNNLLKGHQPNAATLLSGTSTVRTSTTGQNVRHHVDIHPITSVYPVTTSTATCTQMLRVQKLHPVVRSSCGRCAQHLRATWRTSYANFARNICVTYAPDSRRMRVTFANPTQMLRAIAVSLVIGLLCK
jgi:hypothetical protein